MGWTDADKTAMYAAFADLLQSAPFAGALKLQKLLSYLFEHSLAGDADRLKGYTIAVEVFERPCDFDPGLDAIVRVEATRLRNKLREYYAGEGQYSPLKLQLPKGSYQLEIQYSHNTTTTEACVVQSTGRQPLPDHKPSLAVLPFVLIGDAAEKAYFADGMTDALISLLSRFSGLFVISRQSSFAFKGSQLNATEIATRLGVRYLLEGSLQSAGNSIRLAVQLVDSQHGGLIWSDRYDAELVDVFALQDRLTTQIAHALKLTLAHDEANLFNYHHTNSLDAYDCFLRGLEKFREYQKRSTLICEDYFRKAIAHDPQYASAFAFLARTQVYQYIMHWSDTPTLLDEALGLAQTAVVLAPDSPYSHATLGWVLLWRKQPEQAIAACRHGLMLDVNHAEGRLFLSMALTSHGQAEEGLMHILRAKQLTPYSSPVYEFALGQAYMGLKDYEKAIQAFDQGIHLSPTFIPNHHEKMMCLWHLGRQTDIKDCLRYLRQLGFDLRNIPVSVIWTSKQYLENEAAISNNIYQLTHALLEDV